MYFASEVKPLVHQHAGPITRSAQNHLWHLTSALYMSETV